MLNDRPILLVEDNPDDVTLALHALKSSKIANEVIVKGDGQAAIDHLLDESNPLPGIVLLDLNLPKVSGVEVLRALRSCPRTSMVPVVVMTTSRDERDLAATYALHVNSYVVKPMDFNQFTEAVRSLGMYWLLLNEPPPMKG